MSRTIVGIFAAGAVIAAAAAAAQDGLSERFAGPSQPAMKKQYDEGKLDPTTLQECVRLDLDLQRLEAEIAELNEGLEAKRSELEALGDELDRQWTKVNHASQAEATAYRARQIAHRDLVDDFNARLLPRYDDRRSLLEDRNGKFATLCAGKSFYTDDLETAKKAIGLPAADKAR